MKELRYYLSPSNILAYQQERDTFYACLEKESKKRATEIASIKHFDRQYCSKKRVERLLDDNDSNRGEEKKMKDLTQETSKQDSFEDDFGHNFVFNDAEGSREYKENSTVFNSTIHKRDSSVTRDKWKLWC